MLEILTGFSVPLPSDPPTPGYTTAPSVETGRGRYIVNGTFAAPLQWDDGRRIVMIRERVLLS